MEAGLPASDLGARAIGVVELAVGAWAVIAGTPASALTLAAVYAAFAVFVLHVLRSHPEAGSCGCAGAKAVPPSALHVALNAAAAACALAYAGTDGGGLGGWVSLIGPLSIVVLGGLVLAGWLLLVLASEVPTSWSAWSPPAETHVHDPDRHLRAEDALATAGIGPGHASLWPGSGDDA